MFEKSKGESQKKIKKNITLLMIAFQRIRALRFAKGYNMEFKGTAVPLLQERGEGVLILSFYDVSIST